MAIKFAAKDQAKGATATADKASVAPKADRNDVTTAPNVASEASKESAVAADLFDSSPKAPSRRRKPK